MADSVCFVDRVEKSFRVGVPLVAVDTSDPIATVSALEKRFLSLENPVGVVSWDCVRGLTCSKNDSLGLQAIATLPSQDYSGSPVQLLVDLPQMGPRVVVVLHNIHRFTDSIQVVQGISNLRDVFKGSKKILVLLGLSNIPAELQHDVISFEDPLPRQEALQAVVGQVCEWAEAEVADDQIVAGGTACLGVTQFAAENLTSLAVTKGEGLDLDRLWDSKRRKIDQTPGLRVVSSPTGFESIGGCNAFKTFMRQVLNGRAKPKAIVYVDEIEKALGGSGDTSGVSQDQLGQLLSWMQDRRATGAILVGPPGAAKSAVAKASGTEGGVPTIQLDLGGTKGSLVGQSEAQVREALKVIEAVSDGSTLWIATCNSLTDLPPELKRRFKLGTWFFDLPDLEERKAIWALYCAKYDRGLANAAKLFNLEWTGAEIESCCELSFNLGITLAEASAYIVPVSKQAADAIARLRSGAEGRFLSASVPGPYSRQQVTSGVRSLE